MVLIDALKRICFFVSIISFYSFGTPDLIFGTAKIAIGEAILLFGTAEIVIGEAILIFDEAKKMKWDGFIRKRIGDEFFCLDFI